LKIGRNGYFSIAGDFLLHDNPSHYICEFYNSLLCSFDYDLLIGGIYQHVGNIRIFIDSGGILEVQIKPSGVLIFNFCGVGFPA
jgi:hypothetical protein